MIISTAKIDEAKSAISGAVDRAHTLGYDEGYRDGTEAGKGYDEEYIDTYVEKSKKAILGRGGEISSDAGIEALPEAIFNIPADTSLSFYEDEETAYEKAVPSGAEEYALLKSVGGMSYKSNNLIPFPYYSGDIGTVYTRNGVTFTVNEDRSITRKGTAEGGAAIFMLTNGVDFGDSSIDTRNIESGTNATGTYAANKGLFYNGTQKVLSIQVPAGTTVDDTLYPMLNKGSTVFPYEPYFEGLRDTKVTEIVSYGKNLFDADNIIKGSFDSVGGYMSGEHLLRTSNPISIIGGETYVVSCNPSYDLRYLYFYGSENENISNMWMGRPTNHFYKFTAPKDARFVNIGFEIDGATNGTVIDLSAAKTNSEMQLERGSVNTEYKPYREPITYPIPEEVQALEGYGKGVSQQYHNYFDFNNNVFVKRIARRVFDGTEYWHASNTNEAGKYRISTSIASNKVVYPVDNSTPPSAVCNLYNAESVTNVYLQKRGFTFSSTSQAVFIYDEAYNTTDVSLWKEHLAELYAEGNPLTVEYVITEPIETDISALFPNFDNFLSVEGGGTLEFVNEHSNAVPSTVKYTVKVGN